MNNIHQLQFFSPKLLGYKHNVKGLPFIPRCSFYYVVQTMLTLSVWIGWTANNSEDRNAAFDVWFEEWVLTIDINAENNKTDTSP